MKRKWIPLYKQSEKIESLSNKTGLSKHLIPRLMNQGICLPEQIFSFLNPRLSNFPNPFNMKGMTKAVQMVCNNIYGKTPIVILGDYDVDGITSISQLYIFLQYLNVPVYFYIPNRINEGYGISQSGVERFIKQGFTFFVSVDCGIRNIKEVEFIKSKNAKIIIIDHHVPGDVLPQADAIIDPKQTGCEFPYKEMAACGLVFFFLMAIRKQLREQRYFIENNIVEPDLKDYLDITALGTVADVVPLSNINRTIVKTGLKYLTSRQRPGIKALIRVSGIKKRNIKAGHIGFMLGPRLNAGGRIDQATRGVELIITQDAKVANKIALELDALNKERRQIEKEILNEIINKIDSEKERYLSNQGIVMWGEGWHEGVVGIIASRLVDRYYKPAIVLSKNNGIYKGSGRSIKGFDITQALNSLNNLLVRYGGHAAACGLSVESDKIEIFAEKFISLCNSSISDDDLIPVGNISHIISFKEITPDFIRQYKMLEPFGYGNPTPVFQTGNVQLEDVQEMRFGKIYILEQDGIQVTGKFESKEVDIKAPMFFPQLIFKLDFFFWHGVEAVGIVILDF